MKKTANIFLIVLGMLFLYGAMTATIFREKDDTSYYENRSLASMPELQAETVLNGDYFTDLETYLCDNAFFRTTLNRWNTELSLNVLQLPVVNDTVVTDREEVLLPFNNFEAVDRDAVEEQAEKLTKNLTSVNKLVKSYGGTYCYVSVPCQYACYEDKYPWYLNNRSEYTAVSREVLAEDLEEADVPYLDLGYLFADEEQVKAYTSTVDNHYNMDGAFAACQEILKKLNSLSGGNIHVPQTDEFGFYPLTNYYMGSRTRKLLNLVTNNEILYAAVPAETVHFTRYNDGQPALELVYQYLDDPTVPATYQFYMCGDFGSTVIETDREELPDILIYGDSFTNPVESVLYLSCDTMYSLDLRYYTEETLSEFIRRTKPDYVFCLRDYESLLSTDANGGK